MLKSSNPFFDYKTERDAHDALILLLDVFSNICNLPLKENKISTIPEFVDSFFSGIYKIPFICQLCQETNIYYEPFHHIVQSIYEKYLANPPQIATEAIPTVLCSEQPPESQKKSLGKSKWWNIAKIIYN